MVKFAIQYKISLKILLSLSCLFSNSSSGHSLDPKCRSWTVAGRLIVQGLTKINQISNDYVYHYSGFLLNFNWPIFTYIFLYFISRLLQQCEAFAKTLPELDPERLSSFYRHANPSVWYISLKATGDARYFFSHVCPSELI